MATFGSIADLSFAAPESALPFAVETLDAGL